MKIISRLSFSIITVEVWRFSFILHTEMKWCSDELSKCWSIKLLALQNVTEAFLYHLLQMREHKKPIVKVDGDWNKKNVSQKIRRFDNSFLSLSEFKSYSHIFLCREQWWGRLHNEPTFALSNRPFDLLSSRQPPMMKRDMINLMQVYKWTLKSLNASRSIELSNLGLQFTNLSIL